MANRTVPGQRLGVVYRSLIWTADERLLYPTMLIPQGDL